MDSRETGSNVCLCAGVRCGRRSSKRGAPSTLTSPNLPNESDEIRIKSGASPPCAAVMNSWSASPYDTLVALTRTPVSSMKDSTDSRNTSSSMVSAEKVYQTSMLTSETSPVLTSSLDSCKHPGRMRRITSKKLRRRTFA